VAKDQASEVLSPSESAELQALESFFPGITSVSPDDVAQRMGDRMMSSETLDDLFDALQGSNSKSQVGKTFEFHDVAWQPYEAARDGGEKVIIPLAVCDVVNVATGEVEEFISTGEMVVKFLRRAQQLGAFPFKARIEGKTTRSGQTALNLVRP
jgi:hypothetical protein